MNHRRAAYLNAPSTSRAQPQVRFRGEAAMDRQAKPSVSVTHDPLQTSHVQGMMAIKAAVPKQTPSMIPVKATKGTYKAQRDQIGLDDHQEMNHAQIFDVSFAGR